MTRSRKRNRRASGSDRTTEKMFHGLINQGSTCYLNSVLQVLFMNEEFRKAVKSDRPTEEYIDRELSELFDELKKGRAETVGITRRLGVRSVHKQSDAAEHFEKILMLASPDASRIFRGTLVRKTKCLHCEDPTNEEEKFWHLPLTLPHTKTNRQDYSVVNGIEEFFQKCELNEENQLYCDKCDSKSDAVVECEMKYHPDVLTLLLKRFELNYISMSYTKNDCRVDVPSILRIPEVASICNTVIHILYIHTGFNDLLVGCCAQTGQIYELSAFVEHTGSLRSGHYAATIKFQDERGPQWYNFNDSTVKRLNNNVFRLDNERSYLTEFHSPYLLFYKKQENDPNVGGSLTGSSASETDKRHLPVKEDGGEDSTGEDNTAVAAPINRNEEPPIKRKLSDKSGSIEALNDFCNNGDEDHRDPAEQSRPSRQVNEGRDEKIQFDHDGKKEVVVKSTKNKKDETREAENEGEHSSKMKQLEAGSTLQVRDDHDRTTQGDVRSERGSDQDLKHQKSSTEKVPGGKEVNKMKGKNKSDNVVPGSDKLRRKQVASRSDSLPKSNTAVEADQCVISMPDGISSSVNSSTTRNDREKSDKPNKASKDKKRTLLQKLFTRKPKKGKDKKKQNQVKKENQMPPGQDIKKKKSKSFGCLKSKVDE